MNSSELWNKINEIKELAVNSLSEFIKEHIKDSLNVNPYVEQGYCTCIDLYDTDKNGYGICYHVDSIEINNNGVPYFVLADNDEYYQDEKHIQDFETEDLIWILEMLEQLFDSMEKYNVDYLKSGEYFDEED